MKSFHQSPHVSDLVHIDLLHDHVLASLLGLDEERIAKGSLPDELHFNIAIHDWWRSAVVA